MFGVSQGGHPRTGGIMTARRDIGDMGRDFRRALGVVLLLALFFLPAGTAAGQSGVPEDRFHVSLTFGGYFLVGIGYSRQIETHHSLEFTLFPFAYPGEGFPFGVRAGYAWIPSDEIWRAKLGGNVTVLYRPNQEGSNQFSPIIGVTPGIQYDSDSERSLRADLWMSYYLRERTFVPTGMEFFYFWPR